MEERAYMGQLASFGAVLLLEAGNYYIFSMTTVAPYSCSENGVGNFFWRSGVLATVPYV